MKKSIRLLAMVLALIAADALSGSMRLGATAYAGSASSAAARVLRLAERGDVKAQAELGWIYSIGRGVPQDYYQAAKWYRRAAERGHGGAQFALGLLYNKGEGVQKDLVLSYMWLNLSAAQAAGDVRDFKVRIRNSIASKMTEAQVEEAQHLALNWYRTQ